jgi:hypothetical protein
MLECAVTSVSDSLLPERRRHLVLFDVQPRVLLGLADPCAMSVRQIELTDRWLAMWARKVFPYAQQRETEGPVDRDGPRWRLGRRSRAERATRRDGIDALRIPGQARDQRARPPESDCSRGAIRRSCSSATTAASSSAPRF